MDNQVLGYKDLAAIPKDKAILDIERPDLMIYEPHFTYSLLEHVELPRSREVRGGGFLLDKTWGKGSPGHMGGAFFSGGQNKKGNRVQESTSEDRVFVESRQMGCRGASCSEQGGHV